SSHLSPTNLRARRSLASPRSPPCNLQSKTTLDELSISESIPKAIRAALSATAPLPIATAASTRFQANVKNSSFRARRTTVAFEVFGHVSVGWDILKSSWDQTLIS